MAEAHHAFAPVQDAGDSNTQEMSVQFIDSTAAVTRAIIIVLEDPQGIPVCMTVRRDNHPDTTSHLPLMTPCALHFPRAMQVYHERDNPLLVRRVYVPMTETQMYFGPLTPVQVIEVSGGD